MKKVKNVAFKVGDRVVPISKSIGSSRFPERNWEIAQEEGQPYLTITKIYNDMRTDNFGSPIEQYYACSYRSTGGNNFTDKDLIPFEVDKDELVKQLITGQITHKQYEQYVVYAKESNEK